MRMPERTPCWPRLVSSLHLESSERRALLRKRSVPSRRASLHLGPVYRATFASYKFTSSRSTALFAWAESSSLNTAPFWRTAAVVRNGRDIRDAGDLDAQRVERTHRRFASRARALDAHFQVLHSAFDCDPAGCLGRDLRSERRRLARALEAGAAGRRPR